MQQEKEMKIYKGKKKKSIFSKNNFSFFYYNRQYTDEDDGNDSPLSDSGRPQSSSRVYNFNYYHQ
jgi:hypothetical protein